MAKAPTRREGHPDSMGTEFPALWTFPDRALSTSSSGCSTVSFIVFFVTNWSMQVSVSELLQQIIKCKEGGLRTPGL